MTSSQEVIPVLSSLTEQESTGMMSHDDFNHDPKLQNGVGGVLPSQAGTGAMLGQSAAGPGGVLGKSSKATTNGANAVPERQLGAGAQSVQRVQTGGMSRSRAKTLDMSNLREVSAASKASSMRVKAGLTSVGEAQLQLREIVNSLAFECFSAVVIVAHATIVGAKLEHSARFDSKPPGFLAALNVCLVVVFIVEVAVRIIAEPHDYFTGSKRHWNYFDIAFVSVFFAEMCVAAIRVPEDTSQTIKETLQMAEILRMVRVVRIFRLLRFSTTLQVIIAKVLYSLKSLFWIILLVIMLLYVIAVCITTSVVDYLGGAQFGDRSLFTPTQMQIWRTYGSTFKTSFTLFKSIAGGVLWGRDFDVLLEVGYIPASMFVFFVAFTMLALLNIIIGIMVDASVRCGDHERDLVEKRERKLNASVSAYLHEVFAELDNDGSESIHYDEFLQFLQDDRVATYLQAIKIDTADAQKLFCLLDADQSGHIMIDEFVTGCMKLKGIAKSVDVQTLIFEMKQLKRTLYSYFRTAEKKAANGRPTEILQAIEDQAEMEEKLSARPLKSRENLSQAYAMGYGHGAAVGSCGSKHSESKGHHHNWAERIVEHAAFEYFSAVVIITHTIFIGVYIECKASLSYTVPKAIKIINFILVLVFIGEVAIKMIAEKKHYFKGPEALWNIWDVFLVVLVFIELFISYVLGVMFSVSSKELKNLLKLGELFRTARVLRIFRFLKFSRTLQIILSKVLNSMAALFWIMVLMTLLIYVIAVVMTRRVLDYLDGKQHKLELMDDTERDLHRNFGSIGKSAYTLLTSICGGMTWGDTMPGLASATPLGAGLFVCFIAISVFAVLNIVTGVFVDASMQTGQTERDLMMEHEREQKEKVAESLKEVFCSFDLDDDGRVTADEFHDIVTDDMVVAYLKALNIETKDTEALFRLLDLDGSGCINVDEFVAGCLRFKGQAKSLDIHALIHESQRLRRRLQRFVNKFGGKRPTEVQKEAAASAAAGAIASAAASEKSIAQPAIAENEIKLTSTTAFESAEASIAEVPIKCENLVQEQNIDLETIALSEATYRQTSREVPSDMSFDMPHVSGTPMLSCVVQRSDTIAY